MVKTLSYYHMATIAALKSFFAQASVVP